MTEFKKYIERRDRVEAVHFIDPSQGAEVCNLLYGDGYTLQSKGADFSLTVANARAVEAGTDVQVNRGDFLVRDNWGTLSVVPMKEFSQQWEHDE